MTTALVTGARGFIGKHLVEALERQGDVRLIPFDLDSPPADLETGLREADVVYHLAGVNRPETEAEFAAGNAGFTGELCGRLRQLGRTPLLLFSSSAQAALHNPYGVSKRQAEEQIARFTGSTGAGAILFRLKNVFGKWCRPNYNSVVATFCHNIAHDLPITISDPARELELVYVEDVVSRLLAAAGDSPAAGACEFREVAPVYRVTLGVLAETIRSFRASRATLLAPDFGDRFTRCLYGTYLSYLAQDDFAYSLNRKVDPRGALAEFIKSPAFGQIFVSTTKPGITRGGHFHHTKAEKFLVLSGEGLIRFRHIQSDQTLEYPVSGSDFRVVDIPSGYTHSIENVGSAEMVVLFWASEIFDPDRPDTYAREVLHA